MACVSEIWSARRAPASAEPGIAHACNLGLDIEVRAVSNGGFMGNTVLSTPLENLCRSPIAISWRVRYGLSTGDVAKSSLWLQPGISFMLELDERFLDGQWRCSRESDAPLGASSMYPRCVGGLFAGCFVSINHGELGSR